MSTENDNLYPVDQETLSQVLRIGLLAAGLTQTEFAKRIGVTNTAVSCWTNSGGKPRADRVPRIASMLGIEVQKLARLVERT